MRDAKLDRSAGQVRHDLAGRGRGGPHAGPRCRDSRAAACQLSRHIQVELIVSWNIDDIVREVAAEDAVVQLKAQIAAQAGGATSDQRLAIGKLVKDALDGRRKSYRSRIVTTVRSLAADLR